MSINRHPSTDECNGEGATEWSGLPTICVECSVHLCACECTYGHDCE